MMTKREALALFNDIPADLAKAVGVSRQAVNNWEMDEPIPERRELKLRYEVMPKLDNHQKSA